MSQILQRNAYCFILDSLSLHVVDVLVQTKTCTCLWKSKIRSWPTLEKKTSTLGSWYMDLSTSKSQKSGHDPHWRRKQALWAHDIWTCQPLKVKIQVMTHIGEENKISGLMIHVYAILVHDLKTMWHVLSWPTYSMYLWHLTSRSNSSFFMGDVITGKLYCNICLVNENYWFGFVK